MIRARAHPSSYDHTYVRTVMNTMGRRAPRRFAPLDPEKQNQHGAPLLKGIVFDVDGTLW